MIKSIKKSNILLTVLLVLLLLFVTMTGIGRSVYAKAEEESTREETITLTESFENLFGASVRLTSPNGIRFKVAMTAEKKQEIFAENSGKELGVFIFPSDKIEAYQDNYASLTQKVNVKFSESDLYEKDGYWCANGVMSNIYMQNFNRSFIGVGYIATTVGETVTYEYSKFVEKDNVRSMSQVSLAAYVDPESSTAVKEAVLGLVEQGIYASYGVTESRTFAQDGLSFTSEYSIEESKYASYAELKTANPIVAMSGVVNNALDIAVNGEYTLTPYLSINGTDTGFDVPFAYTSSDDSIVTIGNDGKLTAVGYGSAMITISFADYTTEVVVTTYNPVKTADDFLAIGTNNATMAMRYMLMNDIDFEGATVNALSSYDSRNTQSFTGIFDGNGYSFKNLKLAKSNVAGSGADVSLFGYMNNANAVIRNLSVIGVEIDGKGGVISSWANRGTIENCYVEVTVTGTNNVSSQNDIGAFIWRCQQPITIKNCISVVTIADGVDTTYVGGIVGMHLGTMQNCQAIVLSGDALKLFSSEHATVKGVVEDSAVYTSVSDFYASVDKASYGDIWVLEEGYLPHLNKMTEDDAPVAITAANEVYAGNSINVSVTNASLALKESIDGVTLENGVLSVAETVEGNTVITLVATSEYFASVIVEHTVTVLANNYEVTAEQEALTFATGIQGITKQSAGITVSLNGETITEGYVLSSDNEAVVKVVDGEVVMMGVGTANVTVSVNGSVIFNLPVSVNEAYIPVKTADDFLAIGTNNTTMAEKYMLMNDIDFEGATVNALSSYDSRNTQSFTGIFDGNGYSFKNLKLAKSNVAGSGADVSLFGYMNNANAVIRNLSVIGVEIDGKGGVISSWANRGTIENCYVEVTVTGTNNVSSQNDIGAFIWRCQQPITIKNCISVVTVADGVDTTYVGGIVGMHLGTMQNCQAIVLSGNALKLFSSEHATVKGVVEDSAVYTSIADFYANVDKTAYGSDIWVLEEGYLPHLNKLTAEEVPVSITAASEVYAGNSINVTATNATLALKESIDGVTLANGVLSVANSVAENTVITLVATSNYFAGVSVEHTITVLANNYNVVAQQESLTFATGIQGVSKQEAGITVSLNGETITEGYVLGSDNEAVVKVVDGEVVMMGVGTANITVSVNGSVIFNLPVSVNEAYIPVKTAEDLSAIAKNLKGKYILMNDIDFEGAEFAAIGTQKVAASAFAGIFDGNGYSIKNIKPVKSAVAGASNDRSIFGYLNGATIKNLSVIGAEIDGFGGVIGTLVHNSTIENCYVQVTVTGTETNGGVQGGKYGEEVGALVWRTQAGATIKNCITNVTIAEGLNTKYIGAIVGLHIGTMQNCQAIVTGATFENTYASVHSTTAFKEVSNSAVYATPAAFYEGVDEATAYDVNVWAFDAANNTIALKNGCSSIK